MSDYILKAIYVALFTLIAAAFLCGSYIFSSAALRCFDTHDFVGLLICAVISGALLSGYIKFVCEQCEVE